MGPHTHTSHKLQTDVQQNEPCMWPQDSQKDGNWWPAHENRFHFWFEAPHNGNRDFSETWSMSLAHITSRLLIRVFLSLTHMVQDGVPR
jgi:hypothetical protein